jgi:hypothetical protein
MQIESIIRLTHGCLLENGIVLFAATAVEVVDDDEEPVLGRDYKAEKSGSRTRADTVRQYVKASGRVDDVAVE